MATHNTTKGMATDRTFQPCVLLAILFMPKRTGHMTHARAEMNDDVLSGTSSVPQDGQCLVGLKKLPPYFKRLPKGALQVGHGLFGNIERTICLLLTA
jgi:hypothetical protein